MKHPCEHCVNLAEILDNAQPESLDEADCWQAQRMIDDSLTSTIKTQICWAIAAAMAQNVPVVLCSVV